MPLCSGFKGKGPKHRVNHLRPHSNAMQKESPGGQSEHLVFVLDDAILVMGADGAKSYLLGLTIDFIEETFVGECAVIGMVVLDGAIGLGHDLLEGLYGQNRLVHREIPHEVDVDEITDMITKCGTSPNAATCEETGHLRDEPWLS